LQGTYETFAAVARNHFHTEDLRGRWIVTSGLGGMSAAQPLAVTMLDGVVLVAEVDGARARAKVEARLCDQATEDLDAAIDRALTAQKSGQARSIAWIGNVIDLHDRLLQRNILPDVITDMTSAHDALLGYQPANMTLAEAEALRRNDPDRMVKVARDSMVRHVKQLLEYKRRGQVVFDYGNNLRSQARDHGFPDGFQLGVFTELYLRPLFCRGIGPFRWVALSGDPARYCVYRRPGRNTLRIEPPGQALDRSRACQSADSRAAGPYSLARSWRANRDRPTDQPGRR
jgi:urocanate hydratase